MRRQSFLLHHINGINALGHQAEFELSYWKSKSTIWVEKSQKVEIFAMAKT